MTTKMDFNCVYCITHLTATALCLDYWYFLRLFGGLCQASLWLNDGVVAKVRPG